MMIPDTDVGSVGKWISALICGIVITFGLILLVVIYLLPIWWYYDKYVWMAYKDKGLQWFGFICALIIYSFVYWGLVIMAFKMLTSE